MKELIKIILTMTLIVIVMVGIGCYVYIIGTGMLREWIESILCYDMIRGIE